MSVANQVQACYAENYSCPTGTGIPCTKCHLSNWDKFSVQKMSFVHLGQDFRAQNVSFLTLANDFIETTFRYDITYTAERTCWLQISTANESRTDSDNTRVTGLCQQSGQRLKSMSEFKIFCYSAVCRLAHFIHPVTVRRLLSRKQIAENLANVWTRLGAKFVVRLLARQHSR